MDNLQGLTAEEESPNYKSPPIFPYIFSYLHQATGTPPDRLELEILLFGTRFYNYSRKEANAHHCKNQLNAEVRPVFAPHATIKM